MLLDGATAKVYYYNIDNNSKKVLKEEAKLLEDLCFIKGYNAWVSTYSHEESCCISSEDKTIIDDILRIGVVEKNKK